MLKIGDFSKLAQVSVKTLRYYGTLGLLRPSWIDRYTGYRYYTLDQLPRLNRIIALKGLGFSLEQIHRLLREDLSAAELRGMMRLKHAELEQKLQAEQARLARVEARLQQIEQEGAMPDNEVVLKKVPPQRVIGIRDVVDGYADVGHLFQELQVFLHSQKASLDPTIPVMAIYYDVEYQDRGVDAEAAALLNNPVRETSRVVAHNLPGVETMACLVHQGGYELLPEAYNALMSWIQRNGYRVTGPNRDLFLRSPYQWQAISIDDDPTPSITEVQFPVEKKSISTFMIGQTEQTKMEPKIVTKPAFTVVGMLYRGKNENNEIPQMWGEFVPRIGEIKHIVSDHDTYGVCSDLEPEGLFEYVAGAPVAKAEEIPEGMVSWDVPEQKYAVFECTLSTIREAYAYAFRTWLPQSGYQRGDGPDFEHYDASFEPEENEPLFLYIPIK